jgi:hypothetical protein
LIAHPDVCGSINPTTTARVVEGCLLCKCPASGTSGIKILAETDISGGRPEVRECDALTARDVGLGCICGNVALRFGSKHHQVSQSYKNGNSE